LEDGNLLLPLKLSNLLLQQPFTCGELLLRRLQQLQNTQRIPLRLRSLLLPPSSTPAALASLALSMRLNQKS
jgi:hypothetical protein